MGIMIQDADVDAMAKGEYRYDAKLREAQLRQATEFAEDWHGRADGRISVIASDLYAVGYQGRIRSFTSNTGRLLWARELSSYSGVAASRTLLAATLST